MMSALDHRLVADYLARLRAEARRLPADQANELVADIEHHLLDAFNQPPLAGDPSEAEIRDVLERLGTPAEVVDAAAPQGSSMGVPMTAPEKPNRGRAEAAAAILLVGAALLFVVWFLAIPMWVAGIVALVLSSRWNLGDKVLAALSWGTLMPFTWAAVAGVGFVATVTCAGEGCEPAPDPGLSVMNWVAIGFTIIYLAFVVWASLKLVRAARRG
ncbi:HAAS signaling domain-containing protein [Propionibacteriaceae bacterium G1746]|uniref:HAAS signaling domain-containing protein n=1 Tax=Aestuariimicrobium sp. G57 TaxID=3418485 RepID=UPI003C1BD509